MRKKIICIELDETIIVTVIGMVEDHHHHHLLLPADASNHGSMVVIRHPNDEHTNECCVFPPINHENLQIFPHSQHHNENPNIPQSPSSSSSSSYSNSFSPSHCDTWGLSFSTPFDYQLGKSGDFVRWMSIGFQIMRSKLSAVASSFRNSASRRGAFWSIWLPAAAVVMSCWIMMKRRRRKRSLTENETRLLGIIREKDEKISQLLHQISQMNEILIARHKALAAKVAK